MLKVAFCLPNLEGGGAERSTVQVANALLRRGYPVDFLLLQRKGPYLKEVMPEVRIIDLGIARSRYAVVPLARYLSNEKPAIAISSLLNIPLILANFLGGKNTKIVLSQRSLFSLARENARSRSERFSFSLARFFYPSANALIAVSQAVAEDLIRMHVIPQSKVRLIYNPVLSDSVVVKQKETPAHEWLQHKVTPIILAVGRLSPVKDHVTLLQAFALLEKKELRLVILGEGEMREPLEALAGELGIADRVSMPGFMDNPYACMDQADVFVLSSKYEGLPGALIQAMACGVTPVATDAPGGTAEILGNGQYGYLVPTGDIAALAQGMERALKNPMDPDFLRSRAELFSEKASIDAYERLIEEVCAHD